MNLVLNSFIIFSICLINRCKTPIPKAQSTDDLVGLLEGQALAKAVVVSSPIRSSPMHNKEFQTLTADQPHYDLVEENLVEEEPEYVDVPLDVPDLHFPVSTEVSCSTSGCFMFSMCFLRFFHCPFFSFLFQKWRLNLKIIIDIEEVLQLTCTASSFTIHFFNIYDDFQVIIN